MNLSFLVKMDLFHTQKKIIIFRKFFIIDLELPKVLPCFLGQKNSFFEGPMEK
jgi:hypothetical protein